MSGDYQYGGPADAHQHALRELDQLQIGYLTGALTESEYEAATMRVREEYGIPAFGGD